MRFHFSTRYVLIAAVLTLTLVGALTLTGTAAAQSSEGASVSVSNKTATETEQAVAGRVGPIVVEDYGLENSTMTVIVSVEEPTSYAMSDALAGVESGGVTEVPAKQGALESGRQRLTMSVTTVENKGAVTLAAPEGAIRIQAGGGLSVGEQQNRIPEDTVRILVLGTAVGAAGFTFGVVRRKREDETNDYERII